MKNIIRENNKRKASNIQRKVLQLVVRLHNILRYIFETVETIFYFFHSKTRVLNTLWLTVGKKSLAASHTHAGEYNNNDNNMCV